MVYAFFEISYRAYTIAELLEPHVNLFVTILFSHKFQRKKNFHCLVLYVSLLQMNTHKHVFHYNTPTLSLDLWLSFACQVIILSSFKYLL